MGHMAQEASAGAASLLEAVPVADTERAGLLAEAENASDPGRVAEIHERLIAIRAERDWGHGFVHDQVSPKAWM
jgi:ATP-binding cassette subfamily F protein 3